MSLPKTPNFNFPKIKNYKTLVVPLELALLVVIILFIGSLLPKQKQQKLVSEAKKNFDRVTNTTTIKTADGKTQVVPPEVIQITPDQLKSWLDSKQTITIIQVTDSTDVSRELRIKGSALIPKKSFDISAISLTPATFNIFVSKDGIDSALAIVKVISFGLPREKNVNLEGGLDAWKGKGYPVEI